MQIKNIQSLVSYSHEKKGLWFCRLRKKQSFCFYLFVFPLFAPVTSSLHIQIKHFNFLLQRIFLKKKIIYLSGWLVDKKMMKIMKK